MKHRHDVLFVTRATGTAGRTSAPGSHDCGGLRPACPPKTNADRPTKRSTVTERTQGIPLAEQARPGLAPSRRAAAARVWPWGVVWIGVALATGAMVRLSGPAVLRPDEHAPALYFRRLVAGERLGEPLLSTPKPLLTLVHGLAR